MTGAERRPENDSRRTEIMTEEAFRQEILYHLNIQRHRYPAMEAEDAVKFIFQAMLGPGHLLSSVDTVEYRIRQEMDQILPYPGEPPAEMLSPAWCRLSLRRARAQGIPPSVIAGMMSGSGAPPQFARKDVSRLCSEWASSGVIHLTDPGIVDRIQDETWLPSHSAAYREQYHPSYRVISTDWIPLLEVIGRISEKQAESERLLITIDGPCASGKTTLARKLAALFEAAVVHTDEYVIPHARKTKERLAVPGGNCDADRLAGEVTDPWKNGAPVKMRRYDCRKDLLLPEEALPDSRILIVEGSYCNLPVIRKSADIRVFVTASRETREARLRQRESPQSLQMFHDRWIPLEDRYFEAYRLPDDECTVIRM